MPLPMGALRRATNSGTRFTGKLSIAAFPAGIGPNSIMSLGEKADACLYRWKT